MSFLSQIAIALVLSLAGGLLFFVGVSLTLVVALVSAFYGLFLVWCSKQRVGRMVVGLGLAIVTITNFLVFEGLSFVVIQLCGIWLVRCLYYHYGPMTCLADLALVSVAFAAAIWVLATGNVFLTLWTFFLVQALFVWLPGRRVRSDDGDIGRAFEEAKQSADSALQSLLFRN